MGLSDERLFSWLAARLAPLRRWAVAHPLASDIVCITTLAAASLGALATQQRLTAATAVFCAGLCLPLLIHRRRPLLSFALIAAVALTQWLTSLPQLADASLLLALGSLAYSRGVLQTIPAAMVLEVGVVIAALRWATVDPIKVLVGLSGLAFAAAILGIVLRQRSALLASMRERAARLEQERDQQGQIAAAAERARIAREMHDVVSHNLTVMIALADGARYALETAPEQAATAIDRVSGTGRQALAEMRRLLGVLHDEPSQPPYEPTPRLWRLDELVERVRDAGIPVAVQLEGNPGTLSDGVQLAVFRIIQEALTNVLAHARRPASVVLALRCQGHGVEVEVTDSVPAGSGPAAPTGSGPAVPTECSAPAPAECPAATFTRPPAVGAGRGIAGMRERALAYGGTLEAGPLATGGWRVRLVLLDDQATVVA